MAKRPQTSLTKKIETLVHDEASRKNIPTAEFQSVMRDEDQRPVRVAYERRNPDLDPQLIWRGKYPDNDINAEDLFTVPAPPLYIQEKVRPKALIDELQRDTERSRRAQESGRQAQASFLDTWTQEFNGLPNTDAKTEFYQHDQHWSNRMILGDSLQVMASLAEREGLRGKVQCVYFDPPYGIRFNSNFQWSTTSRDVKDGNVDHITREPEQVKAFRDTWRNGIHSYLNYIRDRLILARDLLADSGSIFVQMGDENVHLVRGVMDEVFGSDNHCAQVTVVKTAGQTSELLAGTADYLLWYAKAKAHAKFRLPLSPKGFETDKSNVYRWVRDPRGAVRRLSDTERFNGSTDGVFRADNLTSQRPPGNFQVAVNGKQYGSGRGYWKTGQIGMTRLVKASRVQAAANSLTYVRFLDDFRAQAIGNVWTDTATGSFTEDKLYVVQSAAKIVQRCILMTTDPGDLVLDPTCGSGTTAFVAEQWGRRWMTIDTSRVALALARARIMGARYSFYLLADSREGQMQEAKLQGRVPLDTPVRGDLRQGFVYERVPHITLKSIANNAEIDVVWEEYQKTLEALRSKLNAELKQSWQEWEIPRDASESWSVAAQATHSAWWEARIARQKAIDASIAAKAEFENLYDKPYEDKSKVRVAGPFTVESLSPHRVLEMVDGNLAPSARDSYDDPRDAGNFVQVILDNLKSSGVQQADKNAKINFSSLAPWPGDLVCAEGRYEDADGKEKRAAILIGPEFGTVSRPDLVSAAREAGDANFDVLIACAFNFDAQSSEFSKLGRIPVLKARMNADLHMAEDLKNTGKGNLFVIFGEPDITIIPEGSDEIRVKVNGVDVFHPGTGEVTSSEPEEIACWFVDTDYNEESFFVRQAYFLGANDPYKSLKTTLKAEINEVAWESLHSDTSRPFPRPTSGRIAVKVINHLGDEVMKVFTVH
jgi:adenine-specific DNA-methyltransferase